MKGKKIALLIAALSVASAFAACDGGAACSKHVDSDKNLVCDNCQKAIVYVTEYLPAETEEEVPMVVNPLPTDVDRAEIFTYETQKAVLDKANVSTDKDFLGAELDNAIFKNEWTVTNDTDPTNVTKQDKVKVWNKYGKLIYSWESDVYADGESAKKTCDVVTLYSAAGYVYFTEQAPGKDENDQDILVTTVKSYTTHGELMFTSDSVPSNTYTTVGNVKYMNFDSINKWVAMNNATNELLYVSNENEPMICRPAYQAQTASYGAIIDVNGKFWMHKLDGENWIEVVSAKKLPASWINVKIFAMENGKFLMQGWKQLAPDAVNYDIDEGGAKYDVFQTVIDPATGEEKAVEFGYIIQSLGAVDAEMNLTEKVKNVATILPIVEKTVSSEELEVALDNDLNILYADQTMFEQVAENLYLSEITYDNNSKVRVLVDGKGEIKTYIPEAYQNMGNYLQLGTKIYAWTDLENAKLDLADYDQVIEQNAYLILRKDIQPTDPEGEVTYEYYYFNRTTVATPTKITQEFVRCDQDFIITKVTVPAQGEQPETVEYYLYNTDNELLGKYDGLPALSFGAYNITISVNGEKVAVIWRN